MVGAVGERVRDLIRGICNENEVEIIRGHVSKDHVHFFVSVPPHLAISKLAQYLKGKSSCKLLQENKSLSREFLGRHFWGRGHFVATLGNTTDEVIMYYTENQDKEMKDEDFTVSDGL